MWRKSVVARLSPELVSTSPRIVSVTLTNPGWGHFISLGAAADRLGHRRARCWSRNALQGWRSSVGFGAPNMRVRAGFRRNDFCRKIKRLAYPLTAWREQV